MSIDPPGASDFDFWEFVSCTTCHLPFTQPTGATIPFWLTECGHVICNNHLKADQSCSGCNAQGIQLIPLQKDDPEYPTSEWFRNLPETMDSVLFTFKFQQEMMAKQIRHLRARQQQLRVLLERQKRDMALLKRENDVLSRENDYFRQIQNQSYPGYPGQLQSVDGGDFNVNGKRPRFNPPNHGSDGERRDYSSPRSIVTPVGPNRLTLPPGHQAPHLLSHRAELGNEPQTFQSSSHMDERPGSMRFTEQYTYDPNSLGQPQRREHQSSSTGLRTFQRTEPAKQGNTNSTNHQQSILVSSSNSKFKPASVQNHASVNQAQIKLTMGPPPTPQNARQQFASQNQNQPSIPGPSRPSQAQPSGHLASNRFQPPASRQVVPPNPGRNLASSSSIPLTANASGGGSGIPQTMSGTRSVGRGNGLQPPGTGQRVPFVPKGGAGPFG